MPEQHRHVAARCRSTTWTSQSQEEFQTAASAAIIVLLVMILGMNALAIFIRNKFQRSW